MRTITRGNVSLDGFVTTADAGLDWVFVSFSPELMASIDPLLRELDTILIVGVNCEGQAASWATATGPTAEVMNSVEKALFANINIAAAERS